MKKIRFLFRLGLTVIAVCGLVGGWWKLAHAEIGGEALPFLYIKAVSPGYTEGDLSNVGEMVVIGRRGTDAPISLAGTVVGYTNSSGDFSPLYEFPENSWMVGESILLRLAGSFSDGPATGSSGLRVGSGAGSGLIPDAPASVRYDGGRWGVPMTGGVVLKVGEAGGGSGEVLDAVCFLGTKKTMMVSEGVGIPCLRAFDGAEEKRSVIVFDESVGEEGEVVGFRHVLMAEYKEKYREEMEGEMAAAGYFVEEVEEDSSGGDSSGGSGGADEDSLGGDSGGGSEEGEFGDELEDEEPEDGEIFEGGGGGGSSSEGYGGEDGSGFGAVLMGQCLGLEFSEILTYYVEAKSEQFLELHNATDEEIVLDGCQLRYKSRDYELTGTVGMDGYFVYRPEGFNFTKNPTKFNEVYLVDVDGEIVDVLTYSNGQKKGTAYVFMGYDEEGEEDWRVSYRATPGEENVYQEFRSCEAGKVINPETGNCVKDNALTEVAGAAVGLSSSGSVAKTKTCQEGYYLNVLTGRCNKIKTSSSSSSSSGSSSTTSATKTCQEGYYLNPETGRCKKIQNNDGAEYGVEAEEGEYEVSSVFVAIVAVAVVLVLGLGYLIWEFRSEIGKIFQKVFRRGS